MTFINKFPDMLKNKIWKFMCTVFTRTEIKCPDYDRIFTA